MSSRPAPLHLVCAALVLFLSLSGHAFAQRPNYSVGLSGGWTLPNTSYWSYVQHPTLGGYAAAEWCYSSPARKYPYMLGLKAGVDYIPSGIAGSRFTFSGLLRNVFPLGTAPDADYWSLLLAGGLGCYTRPYARTLDTLNEFIGSSLNCHIEVGPSYTHRLSNGSYVEVAALFTHNSNGYMLKPNQGLNYVQVSLAYGFPHAGQAEADVRQPSASSCDLPIHSFYVSYAPSAVKARMPLRNDRHFYAYTAQLGYMYAYSPSRQVGLSLDGMFNSSHDTIAVQLHKPLPVPFYLGVVANHEAYWGPLSIRLAAGGYLLKSQFVDIPVYERVGVYYHFGRRLRQHLGVALKAHYAHIDYIEWTYGLSFSPWHPGCRVVSTR